MQVAKPGQKSLKHLSLLPFSCIKRIVDIVETAGESVDRSQIAITVT